MRPASNTDERDGPERGRKLAAILHADIAGFSAHMGADEAGTHSELRACLEIAADAVRGGGGRIVTTAGDAFLADFPSVVDALSAAVALQRAVADRTNGLPEAQRLAFRVGINLGDVIIDGDDIYGDGVNVAARIQALAPPGGIAVSETVHAVAGPRTKLGFRAFGRHEVKNIAEPVGVWLVEEAGGAPAAARRRHRRLGFAIGAAAMALVAAILALTPLRDRLVALVAPFGAAPTAVQAEDRPTIAVLPFDLAAADPGRDYFAAGVTEDIISQLGRFSGLLVLSWNAVAQYRDETPPLDRLGRELGVRYVVGGSIRQADDVLRVSVQLSDTETGVLLWSEKYDEPVGELFELQDRISRAIVGALTVRVSQVEHQRAAARPTSDLSAYHLVLRGRAQMHRTERDAYLDARGLFQDALAIDPDYSDALVALGSTYTADVYWGWTEFPQRALDQAETYARAAILADPDNAGAHALLAEVLRLQGNNDRARAEIRRALDLNPNSAFAHGIQGNLLMLEGDYEAAIQSLELALRLDPNLSTFFVADLAASLYLLGRFEEAVHRLEASMGRVGEDPAPHAILAAALARLGRQAAAEAAAQDVLKLYPFFDAAFFAASLGEPERVSGLVEGLNMAGLD